jgi:D-alanine-D-alanine ligase
LCPAPFDAATTRRIQDAALGAFRAVGGRDYSRVDVMVRADGEPVVLEVNTLPGMTETSLFPKAAAAAGISYAELCQRMVELALARKAKSNGGKPARSLAATEKRPPAAGARRNRRSLRLFEPLCRESICSFRVPG